MNEDTTTPVNPTPELDENGQPVVPATDTPVAPVEGGDAEATPETTEAN